MIAAVLVALAALVAFVLLRRRTPEGWTAITDGNSYGAKVEADGSFDFPQAPNSVHYVTRACEGLTGTQIRLKYRIDGGPLYAESDPKAPTIGPTIYFERKGDDWQTDGMRWWATFNAQSPIVPGEHEIIAPFDAKWTSVEHYNAVDNRASFLAALNNAARVGFTFGGGTGYGHGVYGSGRFTLLAFELT